MRFALILVLMATGCGGSDTVNFYEDDEKKDDVVEAPDETPKDDVKPTSTESSIDAARGHANIIVDALNLKLSDCRIQRAGDVTQPNLSGVFRFYLEAVYPDGSGEEPQIFQTNVNNVVAAEVADFLTMIPARVFQRCRLIDEPARTPEAHTEGVVSSLNTSLSHCKIGIWGELSLPDRHGDFFMYLVAIYDDGSFTEPVRFQSNFNDDPSAAAARMLRLVPSVEFQKCTRNP